MNAKSVPHPTPEDLATERLEAAMESAIGGIQERPANLATDRQDAKWSVATHDFLLAGPTTHATYRIATATTTTN